MPAKPRYMQSTPAQRTVSLDASTLSYLDQIAPDNISEALRYCVLFAMQHPDALFRATVQHTAAQCRKHQQRYPANTAPLPTTYGGHVMTARPAPAPAQVATPETAQVTEPTPVSPEPIQPQRAHPSEARPGTLEEYLQYADDDDIHTQVAPQPVATQEPTVIRGQPLSAAALAAVAAIALTDEEIRALDPAHGGARPLVG